MCGGISITLVMSVLEVQFWKVSIITVLPFEVSVIPLVVWREVLQDKVELILNLFLYFLVY